MTTTRHTASHHARQIDGAFASMVAHERILGAMLQLMRSADTDVERDLFQQEARRAQANLDEMTDDYDYRIELAAADGFGPEDVL